MSAEPSLSRWEKALLGLPSIAMGVVPLVAPRSTAAALGLAESRTVTTVVRVVGARELFVAVMFVAQSSPRWLWAFVAQDAVDLPALCWLLVSRRGSSARRLRRTCTAYVAVAVVDVWSAVNQNALHRWPA